MNESQVRKIVRQEIKKHDERKNQHLTKNIKKILNDSAHDLVNRLRNV